MRTTPVFALIEPLESRIAPATFTVGGPADYYSVQNEQHPFFSTNALKANYSSADAFGANYVGGVKTYYLKMAGGDLLTAQGYSGAEDFLEVKSGNVVAFFTDLNEDNEYQVGELTGLSIGKNAKFILSGSVNGDIVSNFDDSTGKIRSTWLGAGQSLSSLEISNANSLICGGAINNVKGALIGKILAGSAADGVSYDFNSTDTDGGAELVVPLTPKQAGPGINIVKLTGTNVIRAGDGGAGAIGGSISNITLTSDSDGFVIQAGKGGDGDALNPRGGAGGSLTKITIQGATDSSPGSLGWNSDTFQPDATKAGIQLLAGAGGNGSGLGSGANGGKLDQVHIGWEKEGTWTKSKSVLQDSIQLRAGDGGGGKTGGIGGGVTNVKLLTNTSNETNSARPVDEIEIGAGNGGTGSVAAAGGKAGAGGSLNKIELTNVNYAAELASVSLNAGNGGGDSLASGAAGGSITNVTLVAYNATLTAGAGSDGTDGVLGTTGGKGGSITGITLPPSDEGIIPRNLELTAGAGGAAGAGNGAAGGSVSNIQVKWADLSLLEITTGAGGDGGKGKGGAGGVASGIEITDTDLSGTISGDFTLITGGGGHGSTSGGNGGAISKVNMTGDDLNFSVQSGNGGDGDGGNGGNGGAISYSDFNAADENGMQIYTGSITSGTGGTGAGLKASGGAGGDITNVSSAADFTSSVSAGNGGAGDGKAAGRGGSLIKLGVESRFESASAEAGDAGLGGVSAGAGGSIKGVGVFGQLNVSLIAGAGAFGGAGGSIASSGYYGANADSAPTGTVTVQAGNGSGGPTGAGAGGSISGLTGFVGDVGVTKITAGNGAYSGDLKKASAGGSILGVTIRGGGNMVGAELRLQAGDAGSPDSTELAQNPLALKTGAKGGDVKTVTVQKLSPAAIFRHVVAGDGGNGAINGGVGGSIDTITVRSGTATEPYNGDIGVRSGQPFGYLSMGGLFAGKGGAGETIGDTTKRAASGNVTTIVADAIASIVAGKLQVGDVISGANLVNKVHNIDLGSTVATQVDPNTGTFLNIGTANFVGAIVNPNAPGANLFELAKGEWLDTMGDQEFGVGDTITDKTDGFVAAVNYQFYASNGSNFAPEALLTVDDVTLPASVLNTNFIENRN